MDFLSTIESSSLFFFSLFLYFFRIHQTAGTQLQGINGGGLPYSKLNSVASIPRFRKVYP